MCYFEFFLNRWEKKIKIGIEIWGIYVFVVCSNGSLGIKLILILKKIWNIIKLKVKLGII